VSRRLFRVTTKGPSAPKYSREHYVVAAEAGVAYQVVRSDLDQRSYGFPEDRALDSVELIAEQAEYPECGTRLHFQS
jgi:hypothetical protein